ncbi:hypothetical protein AB685_14935 [Bacillus sp. LL01]|uniref:hypothetical protein n=1 Tax=Bacillus sp. LL01 TaxID=1665556 RepID=UPI00064D26AC|nr:hypothetical protein [Bacillus sp. LL01]KMJ58098.1 hypothetical protein AB685_14935 [Bacillus sp. LL01]
MSYGERYYTQIKQLQSESLEVFDTLRGLVSELDRRLADIYHAIEVLDDVESAEGIKAMHDLKETLTYRRIAKEEVRTLSPIYCLFNDSGEKLDERYGRASRGSTRIKRQLNAKMTIEEVFEALNV